MAETDGLGKAVLAAPVIGIAAGIAGAFAFVAKKKRQGQKGEFVMSLSISAQTNRIARHGALELAEHWVLALSGLALLLSGLFELPMAARYKITVIPGFGWSSDFIVSLSIHYVASVLFIIAACFHIFHHGILEIAG